ncbi:nucleotidyltransferase family protein [Tenacibaculum ascidiaceicola]|uniref:nucleotidyltransferase family protein n=1 Tax=Tenacibaculum ascidiaceicola TaxID=1699411 RepID=UPI003CE57216
MNLKGKALKFIIGKETSLIKAMKQMDLLDKKSLLVFEEDKFINILSIGDIQRAILKNSDLNAKVGDILREKTRIATDSMSFEEVRKLMQDFRIELMPVVNSRGELIDVYFWEDVFKKERRRNNKNLNLPVVIMAGGFGTRMKPLTNVIPKPLIPIGNSSMLEQIIFRFEDVGCKEFFTSVNYKAEMIEFYFSQIKEKSYNISFFREDKPLGTAGSLHLLKGKINTTFFVSNCDILINDDYNEIYNYHKENKNELTIVSAVKDYSIPYGTLITKDNGILSRITEKPDLNFQINTGFYIVEPHLINEIPKNDFFHITHLIEKLLDEKRRVGVFPVSAGSWKDVGVWDEYLKNINK